MTDHRISISLLLPTRGRRALVERLFDSIVATTANLKELEVVMYIDEDDLPTHQIAHPLLSLVKLIKPPGEKMGRMNQLCYETSCGRYVMLMNDDVVFRTKAWDVLVLENFARFDDDIALVYGNDLHQSEALATLPIVSRAVCDVMGGICPGDYLNLYIDLHLFDVFRSLAKLGYPRTVYLGHVIFEHMHYETGKSTMDVTYAKKNERADDLLFINLADERRTQARMLKRYIDARRDGAMSVTTTDGVGSMLRSMLSYIKSRT